MLRKTMIIICTTLFATNTWAAACNNTTFRNFYNGVQHQNAGNPNYIRFDKTPANYNGFNQHCYVNSTWPGTCFETYGKRYKLVATSGLTTKWSAAICGKARQANYWYDFEHRIFLENNTFYAGPKVSFQLLGDDGKWRIMRDSNTNNLASWEFGANATQSYRWKWFSSKPRQFRIVLERAMKNDEFDLIMDW